MKRRFVVFLSSFMFRKSVPVESGLVLRTLLFVVFQLYHPIKMVVFCIKSRKIVMYLERSPAIGSLTQTRIKVWIKESIDPNKVLKCHQGTTRPKARNRPTTTWRDMVAVRKQVRGSCQCFWPIALYPVI
ncbi:unnamed protein product [Amoebophrya sp. A120]|nr:unnamed protein product [Amoebophrya sp. A120]|eukprot:GSA120T00009210001.1